MISILILIACVLVLCFLFQKKAADTQKALENAFKLMTFEIVEKTRQKAVDETLKPYHETLLQLDQHQRELEKRREGAYAALTQQLEGMVNAENELRKETAQLVNALRTPHIRGAWGEMHLRRVVEIAGLLNHCDFFEQKTFEVEGKIWRPDLIIRLPSMRYIAVDAKTPLHSYLDASDAGDDQIRKKKLQEHALSIRKHIKELSAKEYWKQLDTAPEYVILFLPAEAFYSAALQLDPALIEVGADQNIIVATPTTLIAILRAIAFTWKQEGLSKNAKEIARLGHELYERLSVVSDYWNKVGKNLNIAVEAYNQSVASMESRVMVTARKLKETGSIQAEISEPVSIEKLAKVLSEK